MKTLSPNQHYRVLLSDKDVQTGSRMGGTPPEIIPGNFNCPVCNGKVQYVLTLGADTLGETIGNHELSFFVCRDFDCKWNSQEVIHPSSLIFSLHVPSSRKNSTGEMDSPSDGVGLVLSALKDDVIEDDMVQQDYFKIGGGSGYIQLRGPDEAAEIIENGYRFIFQYSQPVFPDHLKGGADPFVFGVVYVFAKKDTTTGSLDYNDIRAFWLKT